MSKRSDQRSIGRIGRDLMDPSLIERLLEHGCLLGLIAIGWAPDTSQKRLDT